MNKVARGAIFAVCVPAAFFLGDQVGRTVANYSFFEKQFTNAPKVKAVVLRVPVTEGQTISATDLEEQSKTKAWIPFDCVKTPTEAIGRKSKANFPTGHVVAVHDLVD